MRGNHDDDRGKESEAWKMMSGGGFRGRMECKSSAAVCITVPTPGTSSPLIRLECRVQRKVRSDRNALTVNQVPTSTQRSTSAEGVADVGMG